MGNCPKCGKPVSRFVRDGMLETGTLIGAVECGHDEMLESASAVYHREDRYHNGTLCKECAREMFPEGKFYKVYLEDKYGLTAIHGGINGGENYRTKEDAENRRREMTRKIGRKYIVKEYSIERRDK